MLVCLPRARLVPSHMCSFTMLRSFGLSRVMDPTQTHVSGHAMGTAFYVAPEVARGGQLSKHADVFSWGVMVSVVDGGWLCSGRVI